jgi:riboflavin kinase / FMN adenylyltransferase
MRVARSLYEVTYLKNSIVTVGTFDGVHLGHMAIIEEMSSRAVKNQSRSVVVTFEPHPREVVGRGPVKLLSTLQERLHFLEQLHVDQTLVLEFTYDFSRQTPREFYERYIVNGTGVSQVIVGHDHMFGRDREAGVEELERMGSEFGFTAHAVEPVAVEGEVVHSSKIRELLMRGDVELAAKFLGREYSIEGWVVQGDKRGAQLGFPTANIQMHYPNKLLPAEGVYCVRIDIDKQRLFGMLNIGVRPTFHADHDRTIEVNLFDFDQMIYGKLMCIHFIKRLRPENKYPTNAMLIDQLQKDRDECKRIISSLKSN